MLRLDDMAVAALAFAFALMGVGALAKPNLVVRQFGIGALEAAGRSEIRAVYGGFGLAMSGMLLTALGSDTLRGGICATVGMALAGMALGRVVSWTIDRTIGRAPRIYLLVELVGAAALLAVARN